MFDAKSLFEMMVRGGAQGAAAGQPSAQSGGQGGLGELGDLLRQFTEGQGGRGSASERSSGGQAEQSGGGALDELMRQFTQGRDGGSASSRDSGSEASGGGALEDLLRQFTQGRGGQDAPGSERRSSGGLGQGMQELPDSNPGVGSGSGAGGGLGDILGQVFGQDDNSSAGDGRRASPTNRDGQGGADAPGIRELLEKLGVGDAQSGDLMKQLTDFIGNNKVGAGAALGGLGALIFGTKTGRSIAMSAAKIGALALVGGVAYRAYQNYSQGQPPVTGNLQPEAAPSGTGFEADEVSNDAAVTYIRGMIAAAAADGRIDQSEQEKIIGSLKEQGVDSQAEEFLAQELNNPARVSQLVGGVSNQTEALQLYTAARVSIDLDTGAEQQFLTDLADQLGIARDLRAHVDALARGVA